MSATAALIGAGVSGAQLGLQSLMAKKQYQRQRQLMGLQTQNQKSLNRQGFELQKQMWEETNYPAQVKMLKEAGLNPGLMYGMSGGGGTTTGSQGGGAAASGSAPNAPIVDISHALQLAKAKSDIDLQEAQIKKLESETKGKDIENEIARETKQDAMEIIRSDRNIRNSEGVSTQINAMLDYYLAGGKEPINPGSGEGFKISTDALVSSEKYQTYKAEKESKVSEARIREAEANLTEALRKVGANNTTVNAVVNLLKLALMKSGKRK